LLEEGKTAYARHHLHRALTVTFGRGRILSLNMRFNWRRAPAKRPVGRECTRCIPSPERTR
jgi:hypothetical protein